MPVHMGGQKEREAAGRTEVDSSLQGSLMWLSCARGMPCALQRSVRNAAAPLCSSAPGQPEGSDTAPSAAAGQNFNKRAAHWITSGAHVRIHE